MRLNSRCIGHVGMMTLNLDYFANGANQLPLRERLTDNNNGTQHTWEALILKFTFTKCIEIQTGIAYRT